MSTCPQCDEEMTDMLTQFPCCGGKMHTLCALQTQTPVTAGNQLPCPLCNGVLFTIPEAPAYYESDVDSEAVALSARMTEPAFRAGVRAVRSKIRAATVAGAAFKRRVRERSRQFKETVAPHISAIRDAQREANAEIRMYPEAQEAARGRAAAKRAQTLFMKQEHLNYWDVRKLFRTPWQIRWRNHRSPFYVRI